jgi:bifunctional UDP-N-acetylglucosamine pyrophosphorylase/glucosamine-1-phosphate N-acetyltransferase
MSLDPPTDPANSGPAAPAAGPGSLAAVILAAGLGKRMRSKLPKVLHPLVGQPLIGHVLRALAPLAPARTVLVVGHGGERVRATVGDTVEYVEQREQLGTGHAALQARPLLDGAVETVLVLYGDSPLIRSETLAQMIALHRATPGAHVTMLTCRTDTPYGYGRIIRDLGGRVAHIVEERVATEEQKDIREVNSGFYCFDSAWLWPRLAALPFHGTTGEIFLTDMIDLAVSEAPESVQTVTVEGLEQASGINSRAQLAEAERMLRDQIRLHWMDEGVTIVDPPSTFIGLDVEIGQDTILHPGTHLEGATRIGADCVIGPMARIVDSTIGEACRIGMSLIEQSTLEAGVDVGSFNHLRPGAYLSSGVHLGNFAEVKASRLGPHVAMGHFSYVGDATVGANTNIGAGTITVNFGRGAHEKGRTTIGEGVFIGSDTLLVAPLTVGEGAQTGAGSVVTKDVAPYTLVVGLPARAIRKLTPPDAGPAAPSPQDGDPATDDPAS